MSVIIRLQRLPWAANAGDIRDFFKGLQIPEGGVHIVGGRDGDAFIAFSTDEDARLGMRSDGKRIKDSRVKLLLSSRVEMQKVIEKARDEYQAALPETASKTQKSSRSRSRSRERSRGKRKSRSPPVSRTEPFRRSPEHMGSVTGFSSFPGSQSLQHPSGYSDRKQAAEPIYGSKQSESVSIAQIHDPASIREWEQRVQEPNIPPAAVPFFREWERRGQEDSLSQLLPASTGDWERTRNFQEPKPLNVPVSGADWEKRGQEPSLPPIPRSYDREWEKQNQGPDSSSSMSFASARDWERRIQEPKPPSIFETSMDWERIGDNSSLRSAPFGSSNDWEIRDRHPNIPSGSLGSDRDWERRGPEPKALWPPEPLLSSRSYSKVAQEQPADNRSALQVWLNPVPTHLLEAHSATIPLSGGFDEHKQEQDQLKPSRESWRSEQQRHDRPSEQWRTSSSDDKYWRQDSKLGEIWRPRDDVRDRRPEIRDKRDEVRGRHDDLPRRDPPRDQDNRNRDIIRQVNPEPAERYKPSELKNREMDEDNRRESRGQAVRPPPLCPEITAATTRQGGYREEQREVYNSSNQHNRPAPLMNRSTPPMTSSFKDSIYPPPLEHGFSDRPQPVTDKGLSKPQHGETFHRQPIIPTPVSIQSGSDGQLYQRDAHTDYQKRESISVSQGRRDRAALLPQPEAKQEMKTPFQKTSKALMPTPSSSGHDMPDRVNEPIKGPPVPPVGTFAERQVKPMETLAPPVPPSLPQLFSGPPLPPPFPLPLPPRLGPPMMPIPPNQFNPVLAARMQPPTLATPEDSKCVLVSRLPADLSRPNALQNFFGPTVSIAEKGIKVVCDPNGQHIGMTYVQFNTVQDCHNALAKDEQMGIRVRACTQKEYDETVAGLPNVESKKEVKPPAVNLPATGRFVLELINAPYRVEAFEVEKFLGPVKPVLLHQIKLLNGRSSDRWILEFKHKHEADLVSKFRGQIRGRNVYVKWSTPEHADKVCEHLKPKPKKQPVTPATKAPDSKDLLQPSSQKYEEMDTTHESSAPVNHQPVKPLETKVSEAEDIPKTPPKIVVSKSDPVVSTVTEPVQKSTSSYSVDYVVHLTGLPSHASKLDIQKFLGNSLDSASSVEIICGSPESAAFIDFSEPVGWENALRKNCFKIGPNIISVQPSTKVAMKSALEKAVAAQEIKEVKNGMGQEIQNNVPDEPKIAPEINCPTDTKVETTSEIDPAVVQSIGRPGTVIVVRGLPPRISLEELCQFFVGFCVIDDSVRMHYNDVGEPTGDCLLALRTHEEAYQAVGKLNGSKIGGFTISLSLVTFPKGFQH